MLLILKVTVIHGSIKPCDQFSSSDPASICTTNGSYSKTIVPKPFPCILFATFYVTDIMKVDENEQNIQLSTRIHRAWNDTRLTYWFTESNKPT